MKKLILLSTIALFSVSIFAQTIQLDGVKGRLFKGVKPILDSKDETVSGYYTYYMVDKGKKGMRTLEFSIIDKGVTNVVKTPIEIHKYATLNNTVFNGKNFLISYDDRKNKQIVFNVIGADGKLVKKKTEPAAKKRFASSVVYPAANGSGFYIVTPIKEKKLSGFKLMLVDNNLKELWNFTETVPKGLIKVADLVNSADRFVIWKEHGLGIKKLKPVIVAYDAKTGDKIFSRDGYDGTSTIMYNQLRIDDEGNVIAGGAYVNGEKYRTINTNGIYLLKMSPKGKEILYTKVDRDEKIQSVLNATSKGVTVGSKDKIWVEDLVLEGDEMIIISEMFRKNINPKPANYQVPRDAISGKYIGVLGGNDDNKSKVTFEIMDFILFKFDQSGSLAEIQPITKEKYTKVTAWYPYNGLLGMQLAKVMEDAGWFDYGFTTVDQNGKRLMVASNNAQARKPQVFTYNLDDGYAQTKINMKQEGKVDLEKGKVGYFKAMRNSEGKIAVAYFQRKLKRVTINIEDLY